LDVTDFIDVYEPHTSIEWMPRVDNTVIGRRILRTVDDATSVMEHYEQIAARDGWEVESHAPPDFAIFKKTGLRVTLMIQESDDKDTSVAISLADEQE